MLEALRTEYISRLIDGIRLIGPGALFERFGAKFVDHHLDAAFVHRGLNVQNNPVGGTIDSYDDTHSSGAEYSAEQGYFTGHWEKPIGDLMHALSKHPGMQDIYLLSSQAAPVGAIPAFVNRVAAWPGFQGRTVHIYDARRIAEVIVDEFLLDDAALDDLCEHLPALTRILDEAAASQSIPTVDPRRVALKGVEQEIESRLTDQSPVVVISGIGGAGKSDAAAAYAHAKRDAYQTPMWVDGGDLKRPEDLQSINLWRGGKALNIAGMMKSRRCLLIIDDCPAQFGQGDLAKICGLGSHIIATRREAEPGDVSIPGLTVDEAREIVDRDLAEPCPADVLNLLLAKVGGHPLSLALVNKAVRAGMAWSDLAAEVDGIPEMVAGHERLADRMLGRLKPLMAHELTVFEWAGQADCDARFLKSVIRSTGMAKIGGQGLVAPDRPSTVRLHDIVFASLVTQRWLTPERSAELDDLFEARILEAITADGLGLRILATTMRGKLEALLAAGDNRPAFLIALLEIWPPEDLDVAAVGDVAARAEAVRTLGREPTYAEVRAVLESIEGLYRHEKSTNYADAQDRLRSRLGVFDTLLATPDLSARSRAEIQHHRAKALNIIGDRPEAQAEFEAVMSGPFPLDATRLQLVRIYARDKARAGDAARLADEVLTAAVTPLAVSSSVVLGVVEALPWADGSWQKGLFDKHADLIEREIRAAAAAGLEQAYAALASVGRHWRWHDPDRVNAVAAAIPIPAPEDASPRTFGALGEVLSQAAWKNGVVDRAVQEKARGYFEAIGDPDDYARQKHGQLLIEMGLHAEAQKVLSPIMDIETKPFAAYRLSQAQLGQGLADEALTSINQALGAGKSGDRYESTFLAQRFEVRAALNDSQAAVDLADAITKCQDDKYRATLKRRLAQVT